MKISYMLKREDFYEINEKTLAEFFSGQPSKKKKLYVYPELNAIITSAPSKQVKRFLYTEFRVTGRLYKKILVWLYTRICLNTWGLFASKKIYVNGNITNEMLIYPCNRKYRVFDFSENAVSVIVKHGFPDYCLNKEVEFRKTYEKCNFLTPVIAHAERFYTEKIIDGVPLARISKKNDELCQKALSIWQDFAKKTNKTVLLKEYINELEKKFEAKKAELDKSGKKINIRELDILIKSIVDKLSMSEDLVDICLSHGDLQKGNIWIENGTDKIFIIDWESVEMRSDWYDICVLYDDIRKTDKMEKYFSNRETKQNVVLFEEILYRMDELIGLPYEYGIDEFNRFIKKVGEI